MYLKHCFYHLLKECFGQYSLFLLSVFIYVLNECTPILLGKIPLWKVDHGYLTSDKQHVSFNIWLFRRESDSTITNVCSFIRLSVCHQNPSTAWNHHPSSFTIHPSSFFIQSSSLFIHPSFISRLLSFSACLYPPEGKRK